MKNKIIGILIIVIALIVIVPVNSFAYNGINTNITIGGEAAQSSAKITGRIVGTLQIAGTIISIIALIIIGMRYMFSSLEERASMKGVLWYYVIGAVLVFATSNILGFAYDIFDNMDHNYVDVQVIKVATCGSEGIMKRICKDCGKEVKVSISKTNNHAYKSIITESATCTEEGIQVEKCQNCGIEKDAKRIAAVGHNYKLETKQATCTTDGYNVQRCQNCGDEQNKQTTTPALGHKWKEERSTSIGNINITWWYKCETCKIGSFIKY